MNSQEGSGICESFPGVGLRAEITSASASLAEGRGNWGPNSVEPRTLACRFPQAEGHLQLSIPMQWNLPLYLSGSVGSGEAGEQCLGTTWVVTTAGRYRLLLSSNGKMAGMLANVPQCPGQLPYKNYQVPMLVALRVSDLDLSSWKTDGRTNLLPTFLSKQSVHCSL